MSTHRQDRRREAAKDREQLRGELASGEHQRSRLEVFDRLAKESEEPDAEPPPMPDELRDKLVEKFGDRGAAAQPVRQTPAAVAAPSFFARLREMLAGRELAYGGLAVAACLILLAVFLPEADNRLPGGGDKVDDLRGGGGDTAVASREVAIYLYPAEAAGEVVALMNASRPVVVCDDATDFALRLADEERPLSIGVDLVDKHGWFCRDGVVGEEFVVEGDTAMEILLSLSAAADEFSAGAE